MIVTYIQVKEKIEYSFKEDLHSNEVANQIKSLQPTYVN